MLTYVLPMICYDFFAEEKPGTFTDPISDDAWDAAADAVAAAAFDAPTAVDAALCAAAFRFAGSRAAS